MSHYEVKWKGQRSGPFTLEELRRLFESREIGPMHEISLDGGWITARAFFRKNSSQAHSPAETAAPPSPNPPSSAVPVSSFATSPVKAVRSDFVTASSSINIPASTHLPIDSPPASRFEHLYFAGFWMRVMAILLDGFVILWTPLWCFDYTRDTSLLTFETARSLTPEQWGLFGVSAVGVSWLYFTLLEGSPLQASLGKLCTGLLVSRTDGAAIGYATSALRNLAKVGSGLMLGTGFFLALFTPRKQSFHDRLSHTAVLVRLPRSQTFSPNA